MCVKQKRSLAPGTLPKQPKKPRLIKLDPRSSPLQYLNTIRPGLNFKIERTGDSHFLLWEHPPDIV